MTWKLSKRKLYFLISISFKKSKKKILHKKEIEILEKKLEQLNLNQDATIVNEEENKFLSTLGLLSIKPKIIASNNTYNKSHKIVCTG